MPGTSAGHDDSVLMDCALRAADFLRGAHQDLDDAGFGIALSTLGATIGGRGSIRSLSPLSG